jgi:hypothetical protein
MTQILMALAAPEELLPRDRLNCHDPQWLVRAGAGEIALDQMTVVTDTQTFTLIRTCRLRRKVRLSFERGQHVTHVLP